MIQRGIFPALLLIALAAPAAEPEKKPVEEKKQPEVLAEFKIEKGGRHILVPGTINGKEYNFILDSGFSTSVFDIAFRPKSSLFEDAPEEEPSSTKVQTPKGIATLAAFAAPELRLGNLKFREPGKAALHDFELIRRISGRDVHGILGMDALKHQVVQIDFDEGIVSFLRPDDHEHPNWGTIVPLVCNPTGTPMVKVKVPGAGEMELGVDTGTNQTTLMPEFFTKTLGKGQSVETLGVSAAGIAPYHTTRLENLSLGPFKLAGVLCDEADLPLLGLDVLSRFVVTLDFPAGKMYLKKGRNFDRADEVDMSGLHLWVVDKKVSVHSVDKDSPAEASGIKPEDVVLKVGDKNAAEVDIEDLRDLLKSGDGKEITVTIKRGDEEKAVSFKLKKRI